MCASFCVNLRIRVSLHTSFSGARSDIVNLDISSNNTSSLALSVLISVNTTE